MQRQAMQFNLEIIFTFGGGGVNGGSERKAKKEAGRLKRMKENQGKEHQTER